MIPQRLHSRAILGLLRCSRPRSLNNLRLSVCIVDQTRSFFLESLTTPFNPKELRAAATGNPDLKSEYYLVYVGSLARRIATYRIGAFLLSACGLAISPVVVATAELPFMALPVALISCLPLIGYHYLTRRYVLSMHIYIPPQVRNDLRAFTTYVNSIRQGTVVRFRTFRFLFGIKSHIVPVDELQLITVPGKIQAFEKNVEWKGPSLRSRTLLGGWKAWYIQPGLGGQEMDVFWRRIGMNETEIKETREKAVARMKEISQEKIKSMKAAVEKYESGNAKPRRKKIKKITMD